MGVQGACMLAGMAGHCSLCKPPPCDVDVGVLSTCALHTHTRRPRSPPPAHALYMVMVLRRAVRAMMAAPPGARTGPPPRPLGAGPARHADPPASSSGGSGPASHLTVEQKRKMLWATKKAESVVQQVAVAVCAHRMRVRARACARMRSRVCCVCMCWVYVCVGWVAWGPWGLGGGCPRHQGSCHCSTAFIRSFSCWRSVPHAAARNPFTHVHAGGSVHAPLPFFSPACPYPLPCPPLPAPACSCSPHPAPPPRFPVPHHKGAESMFGNNRWDRAADSLETANDKSKFSKLMVGWAGGMGGLQGAGGGGGVGRGQGQGGGGARGRGRGRAPHETA